MPRGRPGRAVHWLACDPDNDRRVLFEFYPRHRTTLIRLCPAADITSTKSTVQILAELADDIPHGAVYTLCVQEPGRPRLAWYEGPVCRKGRA